MIKEREILGIYLGEPGIDVFCFKRRFGEWSSVELPFKFDFMGRSLAEQVRNVLESIRPSRRRTICLAVTRNNFFLRELSFPQLEPDEAASAVHMGIGLHAHLKADEIYHDQWAFKRGDKTAVLLAYIPKNFLDPILREIYETGHSKSLGPVSPATLGLDILLRRSTEVTFPCVSLSCQKDRWIVSLHGVYGWEGSHSLSVSGEEDVFAGFQKLVKSFPFSLSKEAMASVYAVGVSNPAIQDFILKDPCNDLKNLSNICGQNGKVTWGLCAASLGLSSYPAISFQEGIRHKPLHLRLKPYQFVVGATAAAIILITGFQGFQLQQSIQSIHKMEQEVDKLQTSLSPMLDLQKQLTQIENKLKDIEDFKSQQVSELKALKALAELTPPETWIKSFHLENGKLKVMAEGGSAVKTMSNWRQSSLFSEVRLVSPVRKYGQRGERFTVEMKLISVEEGAGSGD